MSGISRTFKGVELPCWCSRRITGLRWKITMN